MKAQDETRERDARPQFDCGIDPSTGSPDDRCVREYLLVNMRLAV